MCAFLLCGCTSTTRVSSTYLPTSDKRAPSQAREPIQSSPPSSGGSLTLRWPRLYPLSRSRPGMATVPKSGFGNSVWVFSSEPFHEGLSTGFRQFEMMPMCSFSILYLSILDCTGRSRKLIESTMCFEIANSRHGVLTAQTLALIACPTTSRNVDLFMFPFPVLRLPRCVLRRRSTPENYWA